jgi:hypothetical protein
MQRHPLDVCISNYFINFSKGNAFTWDMMDIAWQLNDVNVWADHCEAQLDISTYRCRYEKLVAQPEVEIAALLAYLDLPWSDSCLAFHETKRVQATASYAQVNQPIYASSAGRYHHYLANLAEISEELRPLMQRLDYDV